MTLIAAIPPTPDSGGSVANAIQWIRYVPGVVGFILTVVGGYMLYRVGIYNKTKEGLEDTVKIYKQQLEAQNVRHAQIMEDHTRAVADLVKAQQEAKELRSKTDITEVLKSQQELLTMKRDHDLQISATLKAAIDRGGEQYKTLMETMTKTLDYLSNSAREGTTQSKQNHELLVAVAGSINRIADKLVAVENKVDDLQDTTDVPVPKRRR